MLYVSRLIDSHFVAVTDTDDCVETIITYESLHNMVLNLGLDIKGVSIDRTFVPRVAKVEVYKSDRNYESNRMRLKFVYGIELSMRQDQLEFFRSCSKWPENLRLRLSSYCSSCRQSILRHVERERDDHVPFILILDDDVSISRGTFKNFDGHGVVLDTREVTREDTLRALCSDIAMLNHGVQSVASHIVDTPERVDYFVGTALLGCSGRNFVCSLADVCENPERVNALITEHYMPVFSELLTEKFKGCSTECSRLWAWLRAGNNYASVKRMSYSALRISPFMDLFDVVDECMKYNVASRYFRNYIKYFSVSEEAKRLYVQLCCRVADYIVRIHSGIK